MPCSPSRSVHRRKWYRAEPPPRGFQRHHLIPVALLARTQMEDMFHHLRRDGFSLHRFDLNGQILPAKEDDAWRLGHALHRGPHHGYTDVMTARIEQVRQYFILHAPHDMRTARGVTIMRLRLLQDVMRRALTDRHRFGFWLNRRDPMRLFADRSYLDTAIDRLFSAVKA